MATESRPRWRIDDVLARTRLDEVLDELAGPAERTGPGRRWHCPAPDHDDHRASVTMHTDRHGHERWRCWSGDHRGDAIDLVVIAPRRQPRRRRRLAGDAGRDDPRPAAATRRRPSRARRRRRRRWTRPSNGTCGSAPRCWPARRAATCGTGCTAAGSTTPRSAPTCSAATRAASCCAANAASPTARCRRRRSRRSTRPAGSRFVQARYLDVDAAGRKYDNPAAALAPHPRIAFTVVARRRRAGRC